MLSAYLHDLIQDKQIADVVVIPDNAKSHAPRTPSDLRGKFQRTHSAPLSPVHCMKRKLRGGRRGGLVRTLSESNVRTGIATSRWDSEPLEAASGGDLQKDHHIGSSSRNNNNNKNDLSMSTRGSLFENVKKPTRRGSSPDTESTLTTMDYKPKDDNDKMHSCFSSLKQNVHKPVRRGSFEGNNNNNNKKVLSPVKSSSSSSTFSCSLIHNVSKPVRRGSTESRGGGGTSQQQQPLNLLCTDDSSCCSTPMMSAADLITFALIDLSLSETDYDDDYDYDDHDDDHNNSLVECGVVASREAPRTALSARN